MVVDGKDKYVLERWIYKKRSRSRTFWVHEYGTTILKRVGGIIIPSDLYWVCNYCFYIFVGGVTTSLADHLKGLKHRISKDGIIPTRGRITNAFTLQISRAE